MTDIQKASVKALYLDKLVKSAKDFSGEGLPKDFVSHLTELAAKFTEELQEEINQRSNLRLNREAYMRGLKPKTSKPTRIAKVIRKNAGAKKHKAG